MTTIPGGSNAQEIQATLTVNGAAVDLTGKTVSARWVDLRTGTATTVDCSVVGAASAGVVKFPLTTEMVPLEGGYFGLQWLVTVTATGKVLVAPASGIEEFIVEPRL